MKRFIFVMLAVSLATAGGISYFASSHPDGLERVAEDLGFGGNAQTPRHTLMPDYTIPGVRGFFSNGLAGVIGVLVTFGAVTGLGYAVRRHKNHPSNNTPPGGN